MDDGHLVKLFHELIRSPKGECVLMVGGSDADPLVEYAAERGVKARVEITDDIPLFYVVLEGFDS